MPRHRIAPATLATRVLRDIGAFVRAGCTPAHPFEPIHLKSGPRPTVKLTKSEHVHKVVLQVLHAGRINLIAPPADQ